MNDNPTRLLGVCKEWNKKLEKPIFEFYLIHNHMLMNDNIRLKIWKKLLKIVIFPSFQIIIKIRINKL